MEVSNQSSLVQYLEKPKKKIRRKKTSKPVGDRVQLAVDQWIDKDFLEVFLFDWFNPMQSKVVPPLVNTQESILVTAPTASGKTVIAEVAIIQELLKKRGKVVFIAPMRALTYEKDRSWKKKFSGINVEVVTGEVRVKKTKLLEADIIISTPEKWDSLTRKWFSFKELIFQVSCIIIDEVHLLDAIGRGSALECLVARLRRIFIQEKKHLRLIALSATLPNFKEVAAWLGVTQDYTFVFDESYRPTKLNTEVIVTDHPGDGFWDQQNRTLECGDLIHKHLVSNGQALIFVNSRSGTQHGAKKILEYWNNKGVFGRFSNQETRLMARKIKDDKLKDCMACGVGFHHSGLSRQDRECVETGFREGNTKVLFSTSTLAWGVNLPSRVVVIRDIFLRDALKGKIELSPLDLKQMLGRAGRPQYDPVGYGYMLVAKWKKEKYQDLVKLGRTVESRLLEDLDEHINAEIVLNTIKDFPSAIAWINTTFFYYRTKMRLGEDMCNKKIRTIMIKKLRELKEKKLIKYVEDEFQATNLAQIIAKYYIRISDGIFFDEEVSKINTMKDVIRVTAKSVEFQGVVARQGDGLQLSKFTEIDSLEKSGEKKVAKILWMTLQGHFIPAILRSEAYIIRETAKRILVSLLDIAELKTLGNTRLLNTVYEAIRKNIPIDLVPLVNQGFKVRSARRLGRSNYGTLPKLQSMDLDILRAELSKKEYNLILDLLNNQDMEIQWKQAPYEMKVGQKEEFYILIFNDSISPREIGVILFLNKIELFSEIVTLNGNKGWSFPLTVSAVKKGIVTYSCLIFDVDTNQTLQEAKHTIILTNEP